MATYEFQISITPDNFQSQSPLSDQQISHHTGPNLNAGHTPVESPEPVIIQFNADHPKQPYGSGEEGFNITFKSLDEFFAWKESEEAKNCVDYFKVDSHSSKAVPPRFLEHVKLACSRHTRSGQKKYERKYPERQRKTPSKKIEDGCPSFITYKTYVNNPIVKVNYNSRHSHEIGEANLPFTKKYRKTHTRNPVKFPHELPADHSPREVVHDEGLLHDGTPGPTSETTSPAHSQIMHFQQPGPDPSLPPSPPASMDDTMDIHQMEQHISYEMQPSPYEHKYDHSLSSQDTSPSVSHPPNQLLPQQNQHHIHQNRQHPQQMPVVRHEQPPTSQPFARSRQPSTVSIHSVPREIHNPSHHVSQYHPYHRPTDQHQHPSAQHQSPHSANPNQQPAQAQAYSHAHSQPYHQPISVAQHSIPAITTPVASHPPPRPSPLPDRQRLMQDRWNRLENMFGHVRRQANEFEFADVSVSALEILLVRLYLESPNNSTSAPMHGAINQHPPGHDQNHHRLPQ